MKLTSPAFLNNEFIPVRYSAYGLNLNPPLEIEGVPENVKSLVLILDDPDVPRNLREDGIWDHWIVFNIPPWTISVQEGKEPRGVHGKGTGGNLKYHGPRPPSGTHRYFFKLYALDSFLNLGEGVSKKEVEEAMQNHIIAKCELMGRYSKE